MFTNATNKPSTFLPSLSLSHRVTPGVLLPAQLLEQTQPGKSMALSALDLKAASETRNLQCSPASLPSAAGLMTTSRGSYMRQAKQTNSLIWKKILALICLFLRWCSKSHYCFFNLLSKTCRIWSTTLTCWAQAFISLTAFKTVFNVSNIYNKWLKESMCPIFLAKNDWTHARHIKFFYSMLVHVKMV